MEQDNLPTLGVIGLGFLGLHCIDSDNKSLGRVDAYSPFYARSKEKRLQETYKNMGCVLGRYNKEDFVTHKTLDGVLKQSPNMLLIATSTQERPISFKSDAKEFLEQAEKIYPILQEIARNYQGLVIMGSTPVEYLLELARQTGIPVDQLIGNVANQTRGIQHSKFLADALGIRLQENKVQMDVLGAQKDPLFLFSSAKIDGKPLPEYQHFRDKVTAKQARWARDCKKYTAEPFKSLGNMEAIFGFHELTEDISNKRQRTRSCWSIYNGDYFTAHPVKLDYTKQSIKVKAAEIPELDDWEKERAKKQKDKYSKRQLNLVKKFLKQNG